MADKPVIWLPSSETKVTVDKDGNVNYWSEMTMTLRPIKTKPAGYGQQTEK